MKRIFGRSKTAKSSKIPTPPSKSTKMPPSKSTNGIHTPSPSNGRVVNKSSPRKIEKPDALKTHIEVCARIRPLQVATDREGYFESSSRKVPGSPQKKSIGSPQKKSAGSPQKKSLGASQLSLDDVIAWDVSEEGNTAAQCSQTELVQGRTHSYTLDNVYGTNSTTRELYDESIHSLVKRGMEGYHASILAYGQTSTGKTFTMTGTKQSPGLIPLAVHDCFRFVRHSQESREYLIRISYLEVYKEHIRDLLAATPEPIRLFDGPNGLVIKGLKEEVVTSPEQVFAILKQGETRRQVGATHMNQHSSRSHVMVRLWIESTGIGMTNGEKNESTRVSTLSLVDLAGSESVRLNGGARREEGQYINKSLMTLGQVVLSLSDSKTGHIPYRDSKLTRLLQPSLSGNAQMVLLCCISPQASHLEESHNTFKFATRAKRIEQKATVNVTSQEETLLQNYRNEIKDLRQQLADAKDQQRLLQEATVAPPIAAETADGEVKELVDAIKTMERLILKSKPHQVSPPASDLVDDEELDLDLLLDDDDEDDDEDDDLLNDSFLNNEPPKTPERGDALNSELTRIRGLLGSVLQKRGIATPDRSIESNGVEKTLDFSSPPRSPEEEKEVANLRRQLEEQETTTSLRKADSSFLQSQLQEKDMLLEEVSKVLEAVEKRQIELEKENGSLRAELNLLKTTYAVL
jgi:centromeric protein E